MKQDTEDSELNDMVQRFDDECWTEGILPSDLIMMLDEYLDWRDSRDQGRHWNPSPKIP